MQLRATHLLDIILIFAFSSLIIFSSPLFGEDAEFKDAKEKAQMAEDLAKQMQSESLAKAAEEMATMQYGKAAKHLQQFQEGMKAEKKNDEREHRAEKHSDAAQRQMEISNRPNGFSSRPEYSNPVKSNTELPSGSSAQPFGTPVSADLTFESKSKNSILPEPVVVGVSPIDVPKLDGPNAENLKEPELRSPEVKAAPIIETNVFKPEDGTETEATFDPTLNPPPLTELWPEIKSRDLPVGVTPESRTDDGNNEKKALVDDFFRGKGSSADKIVSRSGRAIANTQSKKKPSVLEQMLEKTRSPKK